ncbi:MAG: DinB family protein [Ekhidna sp.]|nr:DinB family protein [Ekhidna sp.]
MIDYQIDLITQTRSNILAEVKACNLEQLSAIPEGFNNNIIWNVAHLIATMDILTYTSTDTASHIAKELVNTFKKGTSPGEPLEASFVEMIKEQFMSSLEQLRKDYHGGKFGSYSERTTSYGVTLRTIEEAITFCNLHESMHYGQIKMLRRLVS